MLQYHFFFEDMFVQAAGQSQSMIQKAYWIVPGQFEVEPINSWMLGTCIRLHCAMYSGRL